MEVLSIPAHILKSNEHLWTVPVQEVDWAQLNSAECVIISGSAFVDASDPYGKKGNPFSVITGDRVASLGEAEKVAIAAKTGTPETIFINAVEEKPEKQYGVMLTVLTPTGKELGACAHGFTGAIQSGIKLGLIAAGSSIDISTTLNTSAKVFISEVGVIALEFNAEPEKQLVLEDNELSGLFGVELSVETSQPIYSVGSPKLTVEVTPAEFEEIRPGLKGLNYNDLMQFQQKYEINGIHIFARGEDSLPVKSMQINAYLGEGNFIDPATGVSNAAQVYNDNHIAAGQTVKITQYLPEGPSAELVVTKLTDGKVRVGGTAVLINYERYL